MEITTLIKWNSIIYVLYYSINLAIDYYRARGNQHQETIKYSIKDLLNESPEKVVIQNVETGKADNKGISTIQPTQTMETKSITFKEPVEDQGIPLDEFLNNARGFSSNINY